MGAMVDAVARTKSFQRGYVQGEHVEGSHHRSYGEIKLSVGSPFFVAEFLTGPNIYLIFLAHRAVARLSVLLH